MQPTIKFENETQALECLQKWKDILSLDKWIINVKIKKMHTMPPNWGSSSTWRTIKVSKIEIIEPEKKYNFPATYCQELILVHELMHIKLFPCDSRNEIVKTEFHAILEDLAKGYIMSKYDVNFDYFENY